MFLHTKDSIAGPDALAQLTQLTALIVWLWPPVDMVNLCHLMAWAAAVCSMMGLRNLTLQPFVLTYVKLVALPSVTRLEVNLRRSVPSWYGLCYQGRLLELLAPARGQLQELVLFGVPAAEQELCHSAAGAAALGAAAVTFCDTCGRRVWCVQHMCCNGN
jgi:hypothetical protein